MIISVPHLGFYSMRGGLSPENKHLLMLYLLFICLFGPLVVLASGSGCIAKYCKVSEHQMPPLRIVPTP